MTTLLAVVVGGLYAAGLYMMLRRSLVKLLVGLILLSHAANLLIFTAAGITRGPPPLVPEGAARLPAHAADPLPQALVLTAIVISLGVLAFAISLFRRVHQSTGTDDLDRLRTTDT
jgi:multicomponent Na+:H+ antiporter subunit C